MYSRTPNTIAFGTGEKTASIGIGVTYYILLKPIWDFKTYLGLEKAYLGLEK